MHIQIDRMDYGMEIRRELIEAAQTNIYVPTYIYSLYIIVLFRLLMQA